MSTTWGLSKSDPAPAAGQTAECNALPPVQPGMRSRRLHRARGFRNRGGFCAALCLLAVGFAGCSNETPLQKLRAQGVVVKVDEREVQALDFPPATTNEDLEPVAEGAEKDFKEVTRVDLSNTKITSEGLTSLKDLPKLQVLDVSNTDVDDGGLETIAQIKTLTTLSLGDTLVSDDGLLKHLPEMANLKQLSVARDEKPSQPPERGPLSAVRLGIDLAGGTNMVFEVDDSQTEKEISTEVMGQMVGAVGKRINPSGTEEITVRQVGRDRIEVIVPGADPEQVQRIKDRITRLGSLEFGILANRRDHQSIIRGALALPEERTDYIPPGTTQVKARWRDLADGRAPGDVSTHGEVVTREVEKFREVGGRRIKQKVTQFLVLVEEEHLRVDGKYLKSNGVRAMQDAQTGELGVSFNFDTTGGHRFGRLTSKYGPSPDGFNRRLAILLDEKIYSAPNLREPITGGSGQITGGFTQDESEELASVLNAGALAVPLNQTPISEQSISPTLGKDVQEDGKRAILIAGGIVLVFMLFYYLIAGAIADVCLVLNLILVMGSMAFIDAAFTLPGLAGIVLTIGMAVDANVLIFERIREEQNRGSSLRMSIQNGFARAFTTIVDANVTTLLTAVILYMIGTDQVKGFAVTLFIGIVMSMFTALYFGRLMFDICERKRWIKEVKMFSVVGKTNVDFVSKAIPALGLSVLLIIAGLVTLTVRGADNLDIDFSGGTMVTFEFEKPQEIDDVRKLLRESELGANVTVDMLRIAGEEHEGDKGTRFRLRTVEQDMTAVRNALNAALGDSEHELRRVTLEDFSVEPIPAEAVENPDDPNAPAVEADAVFGGGNRAELTFNSALKPSTAEDYVSRALEKIMTTNDVGDEVERYKDPQEMIELRGVESTAVEAEGGGQPGYTAMILKANSQVQAADLKSVLAAVQDTLAKEPLFDEVNTFESQVAGEMQNSAILAILASLIAIVGYIWFRFQRITFGLAAVVALVHDVLIVLGLVALASYAFTHGANVLGLEDFKINLPMIAAFLTIVGYSLNDTIVVFDRIREVRGKNPAMTKDMINTSINQTLSRTILTSLTTFLVVSILYAIGGEGIHGFAFCLVMGVIVGTYSSIFVASPVLLWLMSRTEGSRGAPARSTHPETAAAGTK